MIYSYIAPALKDELGKFRSIIKRNESAGKRTVVFCEDRLTLVAERAVCDEVGGTFNTAVYTFARFLKKEGKKNANVISSQGSAMAIRSIIEADAGRQDEDDCEDKLHLFRKFALSASAAQSLYDTIAILYASCIDIEKLDGVKTGSHLLDEKLHDISYIYKKYMLFLEEHNKTDRNMYLRSLPEVINNSEKTCGADIIILGFQAFTGTMAQCVKACMQVCAEHGTDIYGLFTGGEQDIYAKDGNAANAKFCGIAKELGIDSKQAIVEDTLCGEAKIIRDNLFNPRCFGKKPTVTEKVYIFEAADTEQELEFIAANIKKHIADDKADDNLRYANISVMLPSADYARGTLARVFNNYNIPYYLDETHSLESHPLTQFICNYIECVAGNCPPAEVCDVAGSFLFGGTQKERDIFRNYILRCASYRGGIVNKVPSEEVCEALGFDFAVVEAMRKRFMNGLGCLPSGKEKISDWAQGIAKLMDFFGCEKTLTELADGAAKNENYAAQAKFYSYAYGGVMKVIDEAARIVPFEKYDPRQYKNLIKSGFAAAEIHLIPPKADAVFVGDITATVNAGSEVLFACGLTDGVPPAGMDTALLTDRDIAVLDGLEYSVSPKISQVNKRMRETVALNLCAFNRRLYLSYPAQSGGQEQTKSEIISYISRMFSNGTTDGKGNLKTLPAVRYEEIALLQQGIAEYCSEQAPALNWLAANRENPYIDTGIYNAVKTVVRENGGQYAVINALTLPEDKGKIGCAKQLFIGGKQTVSPSLLESYFSCPYKNFLSRGIRLSDRKEGAANPLDTGNIVHEVLNNLEATFKSYGAATDMDAAKQQAAEKAEGIVKEILQRPEYSVLGKSKESGYAQGGYMAERLISEVKEVAAGACEQILAGGFRVEATEKWCELPIGNLIKTGGNTAGLKLKLNCGTHRFKLIPGSNLMCLHLKVGGRIDRIDSFDGGMVCFPYKEEKANVVTVKEEYCAPMVRVIDYKTGSVKTKFKDYYVGKKLQLPLYLLAAKGDRRAAGAYYFPANIDYEEQRGVFTLQGFMDKSGEVIAASDKALAYNGKSSYITAKYSGNQSDKNMEQEVFDGYIEYSRLIARQGAEEIFKGVIVPSPYENACKYCTYGGMCGFSKEQSDERKVGTISAAEISQIASGGQAAPSGQTLDGQTAAGGQAVPDGQNTTVEEDGNGN